MIYLRNALRVLPKESMSIQIAIFQRILLVNIFMETDVAICGGLQFGMWIKVAVIQKMQDLLIS